MPLKYLGHPRAQYRDQPERVKDKETRIRLFTAMGGSHPCSLYGAFRTENKENTVLIRLLGLFIWSYINYVWRWPEDVQLP